MAETTSGHRPGVAVAAYTRPEVLVTPMPMPAAEPGFQTIWPVTMPLRFRLPSLHQRALADGVAKDRVVAPMDGERTRVAHTTFGGKIARVTSRSVQRHAAVDHTNRTLRRLKFPP